MPEEEKPAALPEKECGAAKSSDQPQGLSGGPVESSAKAQIVPEESSPTGALHEQSVKEVTEVSPELKTPSSAREGVSFSGSACVLLQMISPAAFQPNAFPTLCHRWVFSLSQDPISGLISVCGLCRCCVAAWFSAAAADLLVFLCHDTIRFAARLIMLCELLYFFFTLPPSSQMFASHIANTCIFLFLFWEQQLICFSLQMWSWILANRGLNGRIVLFATAMCYFLCFNEYWFGFLKSSC